MLPGALRQVFTIDRAQLRAQPAVLCMVTIAAALAVGCALQRPVIGMIAAGGAMSVGMGSFQRVGRSRIRPMLWASIGMGLFSIGGSAVGHSGLGAVLNAGWVGFAGGMLVALGPGAAWVGLQCAIAALVASGYPSGMNVAFSRAALLLAGGLVQTAVVAAYWHFVLPWKLSTADDPYPGFVPALRVLRENLSWRSTPFRFAVREAVTLASGAALAHFLQIPNGYWIPMTSLLVMKPNLQQTVPRGIARVGGTIVGAILATVLVAELRPNLLLLAVLIVLFAWISYSIVTVNYAAFSISLTAYIVCLLAFAGLPAGAVVLHRTVNTTAGGALALLSYATTLWVRRKVPVEPGPRGAVAASAAAIEM